METFRGIIILQKGAKNVQNRIYELRQDLGLSQTQFGDRLGLTRSTVSRMESGTMAPTKQTLKFICREYNVSYLWLTEGEGDMFRDDSRDILSLIDIIMSEASEAERDAFRSIAKLDKKYWVALNAFMDNLLDE